MSASRIVRQTNHSEEEMKQLKTLDEYVLELGARVINYRAEGMSGEEIAKILNKEGWRTLRGQPIPAWYASRIAIHSGGDRKCQRNGKPIRRASKYIRNKEDTVDTLTVLSDLLTSNLSDRSKRSLLKTMGIKL